MVLSFNIYGVINYLQFRMMCRRTILNPEALPASEVIDFRHAKLEKCT